VHYTGLLQCPFWLRISVFSCSSLIIVPTTKKNSCHAPLHDFTEELPQESNRSEFT
jgi:hypothetical protein